MSKHNKGERLNPEVLTHRELSQFLESFKPLYGGVRDRAIFATLAFSGLRCNEALSLRVCDVNLEKGTATVIQGKGGKRRTVGIGAPAVKFLTAWLNIRPAGGNYFFCTRRGKKIDTAYMRKIAIQQGKRAGIAHRVHTHCFRHTAACMMADAGLDLRHIQIQLGHNNISTTDTYLRHINPARTLDAIRSMDWGA